MEQSDNESDPDMPTLLQRNKDNSSIESNKETETDDIDLNIPKLQPRSDDNSTVTSIGNEYESDSLDNDKVV